MSEFNLSDFSDRDKPWDYHRDLADQVQELYRGTEFESYGERIAQCAQLLEFALVAANEDGDLVFKLFAAWFCRVRHCPICQWRRSLMWKARFIELLPSILADYPTARWLLLTLTVKNCPVTELRDNLKLMNESWKRLGKRKIFPAIGWVRSTEVTRNRKDGSAHPHFHILMMVPESYFDQGYITQQGWRQLWQQSLRVDYDPTVDVRAVKARSVNSGQASLGTGIFIAIKEVLKYAVKGNDLVADASWLIELTHQLHKTRAIGLGGVLKNYFSEFETLEDIEDLIHGDHDQDEETTSSDYHWLFNWKEVLKRYVGQPKEHRESDDESTAV